MTYYLGIDIGTFESKGILADQSGNIIARAAKPHKMLVPQVGWAEHRPVEDWWDDFTLICQKLLADSKVDPREIKAVGTSAIGPCMLPVNKAGEPLMNAVLYGVDTRSVKEIDDLTAQIGAERILDYCGNALTSQSVGPKILWLKRNRPDIFANTHKILTSTSYLVFWLTGKFVIDHYSAANAAPLYSAEQLKWSDELAPDIIPLERLPDIAWTTDIAGAVTAKAARETGLAEGTPVICGTIDAAAEAISVGVLEPRDMMLMYGSTIFIIAVTSKRVKDGRLWYAPWLFPGQHASMAGLATSGTLTHWFRDTLARELAPAAAMEQLAAEAETSPPGANGLVMLPYFSGERTPIHDTHAKGVIFGLNLTHTRGDLYRAALEGIACGTNHILETFDAVGETPRHIFSVGGGTKNRAWAQATSDVSGRTQILSEKSMGASYGDAFLAALAVGDVKAQDIKAWNPVVSEIVSNTKHTESYRRHYRVFRELYDRNRDLMRDLGN
ncbi:MAG: FGGY-family carbohydrate kinase [Aestuariivirga sp.]